jgi:hypothetical protein
MDASFCADGAFIDLPWPFRKASHPFFPKNLIEAERWFDTARGALAVKPEFSNVGGAEDVGRTAVTVIVALASVSSS